MDAWWKQERKSARKRRAMAVAGYGVAVGHLDQAELGELEQSVWAAQFRDVPVLVADVPMPRWDLVPITTRVDDPQRDFAVALLDVEAQCGSLSGADRKWRTIFARHARTAGDLLVLFLDLEPHLRDRREDPEMAPLLERLAFVPEALQARGRGRLTRAEFDSLVERAASGESLDTLRAELGVRPRTTDHVTGSRAKVVKQRPAAVEDPPSKAPVVENPPDEVPVVEEPVGSPASVVQRPPGERAVEVEQPAGDMDRARVAKYLERALIEERLDPGEHAARTVALWSATTTRELARLVVDLPVPVNDPLRDRKPNPHSDDLITPAHRQAAVNRLNRAMAGHALTLWEYEARLDVALRARTFDDLWPATADLPPGW